ncbi:restriction endonuclease subunit S [Elizabethkingia ursingii]|uniref:restriction endonuclease subunit S n=1 Tax=Elizabethkingia ursingii TaxID=1756150 RepID=UPI002013BD1A|nr:restriction endonuclease subunit S [Elizabethkingia ursingii]MCL1665785.1 restriction endonuclease subunit S [Elizabethkingia ursingii]
MRNWKKVKLGTLLTESRIVSEKPNADKRIRVKLNVLGVEKRPFSKDKTGATKYFKRKEGQFIYGKQNLHKGAFGIVPKELDGYESTSDIPAFDVDKSCHPEWIYYFFRKGDFYLKLEKLAKGVGSKRIHPSQIYDLEIFLPTIEEQKKILEQINKIEQKNLELYSEFKSQEENSAQLRKSILQDAIHGRLTNDWRKSNGDKTSVKILIEEIGNRREDLIKKKIIKDKSSIAVISDNEIPFEIPISWRWCRMQFISEKLGAGSTPKGGDSAYVSEGVIFLRSQNVYNEGLHLDDVALIPKEIHDRMKGTKVNAKDILLNITGASIGRCALIADDFETANVNQHVAIIRLINLQLRFYIHKLIMSPYFQEKIMEVQVGVSREGLSMSSLKKLLVPLPPIEEQEIIVEIINRLQEKCDRLDEDIFFNKKKSNSLYHSSLLNLLGDENNSILDNNFTKNIEKVEKRIIKYNSKTKFMDLVKILEENGKIHAEDLWKMSKFPDNIDAFYAELKKQIEVEKTIKESTDKGYIELV